ncbi:hypothetical protein [Amycolatopsis sp. cmx-4-54]|uniref:hypothetical protein n=1 Tax=Amycolatopsis sp. cmx-4-54 TaxID=2790936 RepID=UPI003977EAE0
MPLYLPAPESAPRGPDGRGWNRLTLGAHYGRPPAQCALRPRTYPTLHETLRTTELATFGYHGRCVRHTSPQYPDCRTCPVFTAAPTTLDSPHNRVLVRIEHRTVGFGLATLTLDIPYVVAEPDQGWDSPRDQWSWDALARITGWRPGREHHDHHSPGFWLERSDPGSAGR